MPLVGWLLLPQADGPRGSVTVFLFTLGNSADKLAGLEQGKSQHAIRPIA
jgi:hypothetical protein